MTIPPDISHYLAAAREEHRQLCQQVAALQARTGTLSTRAAELGCLIKFAEKFQGSCESVGSVIDYVSPDELVGDLPRKESDR